MPMNPRLLRPTASGVHPEAAAWRTAVVANGGSVSASTMRAVSKFCADIDATPDLRSRFFRLNLFCGDSDANLVAVRTPLYRGQSRTGSQWGNATDTNNAFQQADYTETGASGGLTATSNTSKYLGTGLIPFNAGITEQNYHNSGYFPATLNTTGDWIGASGAGGGQRFSIFFPAFSTVGMYVRFGGGANSGIENASLVARTGHLIGQRSSGTGVGYRNGSNISATSITTGSQAFATNEPPALNVFARNAAGSPSAYWSGRACMYSVGLDFSDAQALAFYNAVQTFQTALGRQL
jgi:hypothetical protein